MERKKSSGQPFKMRSPKTPYPFLGAIGKGLKNMLPGSKGNAPAASGGADDVNTKIDEIHAALVGSEMGSGVSEGQTLAAAAKDAALPKKTGPMYHKPHVDADGNVVKLSTKTKDSKGVNHYHTEEYTQDYQDRPDKEEKK